MGEARTRRPVHVLPALLAVIALVAGCGGPSPAPSAPAASPPPGTATSSPSSQPSSPPSSDPTAWSPVTLPDMPRVATLEPLTAGSGAVATNTAFRLQSLDGRSPAEAAAHLVAQPEVEFNIVSLRGDTAIVKPANPLAARTTYRISLTRADGSTEASWIANAAGPLQITETVPGNASTKVPLSTGIEIRFDQYGVTTEDLRSHFSIRPTVAGRFVAAGQTLAFMPNSPLAKGRLYTVTISRGLPLPGTGETLEGDYTFRFETAAKEASPILAAFTRASVDSSTTDRPAIAVEFGVPEGQTAPRSLPITVHRVNGATAAQAAWRAIIASPEWTLASTAEAVPTSDLAEVFRGTVQLRDVGEGGSKWFALPTSLAAGWYIVTERWPGVPRQLLLQVTDLATFSMVSSDRTLVWVNDLRTKGVVEGAIVTLGGAALGRTDSRGLAVGPTPEAVASSPADKLVVVASGGRTAFYPLTTQQDCAACASQTYYEGGLGATPGPVADGEAWWRLVYTDRSEYRTTDTVNVWGMARNRDTGTVPGIVTLVLSSVYGSATPIATANATTDQAGAFAARLALRDVPVGQYAVRLLVDGAVIAESWVDVATIAKPAWQLSLDTAPHAVVGSGSVSVRAQAAFFEGTPVAGTSVSVTDGDGSRTVRTNASGLASTAFPVAASTYCAQQCDVSLQASATLPEEGEIQAWANVAVFKANGFVDVDGSLSGTRLTVTGKVSSLALERFEVPGANLSDVNPRGGPLAGARVVLGVTEEWSVRVRTGTRYDFITKQVVPTYEDQGRTRTITVPAVESAADGTFRAQVTVRGGDRYYRIAASYSDSKGRATTADTWASQSTGSAQSSGEPAGLSNAGTHPGNDDYTLGETVRVKFTGGLATTPPVARYLYAISQRGLRYVTVGTTPTFRTTFDAAALPSISISAVRFNGYGYETALTAYTARADPAEHRLTVQISADRERYAPGDTATVSVRTLAPDGAPVSASVYVGVVDEKLYAMGIASEPDPLGDLYQAVGDGMLAGVTSHQTPADDPLGGQGGDTMGGGGPGTRVDFRDWLVATLLTTDASGRATVRVPLADDLTSWHVAASALDASLRAGSATGKLAVGLPFFVEATVKPDYLQGERLVLRVRGFGTSLQASDQVAFTVSSDTLGVTKATATAKAFEAAEVALPALPVGTHTVRISGTARGHTDTLVRSFTVVASRSVKATTTWEPLSSATSVKTGSSGAFTGLLLVDAGRGRVIPALQELASLRGGRSDQMLAARLANRVLFKAFGLDPVASASDQAIGTFEREGGLAIVPYGSTNLDVTALAAMAADPRIGVDRTALSRVAFDERAKRDRRLLALAGLAALGDPVLGQVRSAAALTDLTTQETVSVALAALFAGDEALATRLEREVLAGHGLAYGPWIRVNTGQAETDILTTARLAIVAASLGDPVAAQMDAWLESHPATTTLTVLERALAARGWADRVSGAKAVAAVTVDGVRREVTVEPGKPVPLALTSAQAASARLEPVSGSVLLVTTKERPLAAGSLTKPDGVTFTRSVSPTGRIGLSDRVVVTIRVTLSKAARQEVWRLVDWTPSGLTAIGGDRWDTSSATAWTVGPGSIDGQRVEATIGGDAKVGTWTLRYIARVVSPGVYRWEGSVIQSAVAPDHGIVLDPKTITIGGASGS